MPIEQREGKWQVLAFGLLGSMPHGEYLLVVVDIFLNAKKNINGVVPRL